MRDDLSKRLYKKYPELGGITGQRCVLPPKLTIFAENIPHGAGQVKE